LNRVHAAGFNDWNDWRDLLKTAGRQEVGIFAIKAAAKRLWEKESQQRYNTWYEPFDSAEDLQKSLWYTLNQPVSSAVTPGELKLLPVVIQAAQNYRTLSVAEQDSVISEVKQYPPLYAPFMD
ncbi:MAG TPA: hypothetical protein VLH15_01345, partial [Dehalococcoidales bacterium]|nr:hypothetical protein [Dehalococcoidales bacterium]